MHPLHFESVRAPAPDAAWDGASAGGGAVDPESDAAIREAWLRHGGGGGRVPTSWMPDAAPQNEIQPEVRRSSLAVEARRASYAAQSRRPSSWHTGRRANSSAAPASRRPSVAAAGHSPEEQPSGAPGALSVRPPGSRSWLPQTP
ncbi:MAG: hypothetical protein ACPGUV_06260, partial [Polyangiales bacterium]